MKKFEVRWPFYLPDIEKWFWVGEIIEEDSEAYKILKNVPNLLKPVIERVEKVEENKKEVKKNGKSAHKN